jgi:hypothetical protein
MLNTYATGSSSESNWYNEPILDNSLNFKATLDWGNVYTSWSLYNKNDWFVYYKVVRSQDNTNPVYPDNWYIYYTTDVNNLSYNDTNPLNGTSYYRVCAITSEKNRYCSNVVKIYKEKIEEIKIWWDKDAHGCYISAWYSWCETKNKCIRSWEEKCEKIEEIKIWWDKDAHGCYISAWYSWCETKNKCIRTWEEKCEIDWDISITLKLKADKLVKTFLEKVEKTYSTTEKRISILNKIIDKLNALAIEKPTQKNLINYIVIKIKNKIDSYNWSDLGDIESIFNDLQ